MCISQSYVRCAIKEGRQQLLTSSQAATSTAVTWGYLISKANEDVFEIPQSHLVVASAITALGAVRQAKSHVKATIGIGNSVEAVKAVVKAVGKIANWADKSLTLPDVDDCAAQIQQALKN